MNMKGLIAITVLLLTMVEGYAQQDAMYTHYMYNTLAVNPGYAGSRDALTVTALHRSQWVGFDGASRTQTLTMHTPFIKNYLGLGFSMINDKTGPTKSTSLYIDMAYHLKLNEKSKLSFGLKTGGDFYYANLMGVNVIQDGDNSFSKNIRGGFIPNFGVGIYYLRKSFYAGLSVPKLVQNNLANNNPTITGKRQRHYFFITGAVYEISSDLKLKPTALLKVTPGAPIEADLTLSLILKNKFNLGAMYRTQDAAGILLGYNIMDQLMIGYSFDWSFLNTTGRYNSGSHEIMARYDFIYKSQEKIRSPRYF
jgi:type IX secretion system PorP/SprF family membrane protein